MRILACQCSQLVKVLTELSIYHKANSHHFLSRFSYSLVQTISWPWYYSGRKKNDRSCFAPPSPPIINLTFLIVCTRKVHIHVFCVEVGRRSDILSTNNNRFCESWNYRQNENPCRRTSKKPSAIWVGKGTGNWTNWGLMSGLFAGFFAFGKRGETEKAM